MNVKAYEEARALTLAACRKLGRIWPFGRPGFGASFACCSSAASRSNVWLVKLFIQGIVQQRKGRGILVERQREVPLCPRPALPSPPCSQKSRAAQRPGQKAIRGHLQSLRSQAASNASR